MDFAQQTTPQPIQTEPILPTPSTEPVVSAPPKESSWKKMKEKWSSSFAKKNTSDGSNYIHKGSSSKKSFKKNLGTVMFVIIVGFVTMIGIRASLGQSVKNGQSLGVVTNGPEVLTVPIHRDFLFPVYDSNKELSESITYTITEAQLTKQIVVQGKKATAVQGRIFLVLNLKLVNPTTKSLFLNTRNYVRIQPAGSTDKLAGEMHSDTTEAQPSSTKLTRLGLPVDEGIKEFTLYVGELEGEKEEIHITFP